MMRHSRFFWIVAISVCAVGVIATPLSGRSITAAPISRTVYVTVTGDKGALVTDLAPADFVVKEGGKERDIVKVEPATAPMTIAILVEESLSGDRSVREGVFNFAQKMGDKSKIALFLVGRRAVQLNDYTADLQPIVNAINTKFGLNAVTQDENFTEAVYEVAKNLEKIESSRRVIVAVAIENRQSSSMMPEQAMDELQKSGALFYAATLPGSNGSAGLGSMVDEASRGKILGDGTKQTGGRRQEVTRTTGLPGVLQSFSDELLHQHAITYMLPDGTKPDPRFSISAKRKGLTVRAPSRIPAGE